MATKKKANTVDKVVEADKENIPQSSEKSKKRKARKTDENLMFSVQLGNFRFELENVNGIHQQKQEIKITSHNVCYHDNDLSFLY